MKFFTRPLLLAFVSLLALLTNAQSNDPLEIKRNEKGKVTFARFHPNIHAKIQEGEKFLKSALKAKPDDDLRLNKDTVDMLGITHNKYFKDI